MKTEPFYQRKLSKYFDTNFSEYDEDAEFYPDPDINEWYFKIPVLGVNVLLTCDDSGAV